jgi:hypothetical protein
MSRGLALGAIAALAGLAAVRSRSGSRSKLRPVPEGFSTSSYLAVRGTVYMPPAQRICILRVIRADDC